jgi:hypothetical protein
MKTIYLGKIFATGVSVAELDLESIPNTAPAIPFFSP